MITKAQRKAKLRPMSSEEREALTRVPAIQRHELARLLGLPTIYSNSNSEWEHQ